MRQVIDASVILAYLLNEPGGDIVTRDDGPFHLSTVNLSEILTKVVERGLSIDDAMAVLRRLPVEHVVHDRVDALATARLRPTTRSAGLSLGDRACLALATRLALPVLTADTAWAALDLGIDVRLIR